MDFRTIKEEYNSIYSNSKPELLSEETQVIEEQFDESVEPLFEESVVEEIVLSMLEEGYDLQTIEDAFDDVLDEAKVSYGHDTAARKDSGGMVGSRRRLVKKTIKRAGAAAGEAGAKAKDSAVAGATSLRDRIGGKVNQAKAKATTAAMRATGTKSSDVKTKSGKSHTDFTFSPGRKTDRKSARAAIKGNLKKRAAQAQVDAYNKGREAAATATDAKNRAVQTAKNQAGRAQRGIMSRIDRAKEKVRSAKAGVKSTIGKAARRVADRMGEETTYDTVLKYLYVEGHADTLEEAEAIMVNLSQETIQEILEDC